MKKALLLCIFFLSSYTFSDDFYNNKMKFVNSILHSKKIDNPYWARTILALRCTDTEYIPKVFNAGETMFENGVEVQIMHNGLRILKGCYYDYFCPGWMTETIRYLRGHHEPQEEKVFYEVLKYIPENSTMIELGCYWGYYSMWFKTSVKNSSVYLVEPNEDNLKIAMKNFQLNGLEGDFTLGYLGGRTEPCITQDTAYITVESLLKEKNIDYVDILHSDIQGAEYIMLKEAKEILQNKKIGFLFISTHSDDIHFLCLNLIKSCGYKIIAHHTPSHSFTVDGLIAAKDPSINGPEHITITK